MRILQMISLMAVTTNTIRIGRSNTLVSAFSLIAHPLTPVPRSSKQRSSSISAWSSSSILPKSPAAALRSLSPSYRCHLYPRTTYASRSSNSSNRNAAANLCTRLFSTAPSDEPTTTTTQKARVLFLGTPDVAAASLRTLVEESANENSCYELVGVVTQPPKRRKRRGKVVPSPVGLVAEELDIPVLCPEKAKDPAFLEELENNIRPDLCITAAYGQYLPKRFLAIPKYGTLNIHPSLLPRWRGASPVQRSLQAGDNPVGVSVLFTVSKMDAGPIVRQEVRTIDDEKDTATTLLPSLFDIGTSCLLDVIPDVVAGRIDTESATVQDEENVVNADMIGSEEGELFLSEDSARVCHNKVRGFSMWPGTFMYCIVGEDDDGEEGSNPPVKMKVIESRVLDERVEQPTDEIELGPEKGDGLRVVCGDGSVLELLRVQPVTRKEMDAKSFVNGLRGARLRWTKLSQD